MPRCEHLSIWWLCTSQVPNNNLQGAKIHCKQPSCLFSNSTSSQFTMASTSSLEYQLSHGSTLADVINHLQSYTSHASSDEGVTPDGSNLTNPSLDIYEDMEGITLEMGLLMISLWSIRALIDAPLIPAGFWSFLWNPVESGGNLAETPAKMTFWGTNIPVE